MQVNNPTLKKYLDEQLVLVSLFVDGKLICEWRSREARNNERNSSGNQLQTIDYSGFHLNVTQKM